MAYANNFVVKNGLTVGTTQVINSTGIWVGPTISATGADATQNLAIQAAYTRANNSLSANSGGVITGDVTITGSLIVNGTTTTVNTSTVTTTDSLIKLANNNIVGDTLDIGFYGQSNNSTNVVYHGLVRRAGADFFLFKNLPNDPTANVIGVSAFTAGNTGTLRANISGGMISGLANSIGILDGGTGTSSFTNNQLTYYSSATSSIVSLANTGTAGTTGSSTVIPQITTDGFGRVSGVSGINIDTSYTTAAYTQANTAQLLAQAAYNQANVTVGVDATQNASITVIQGVDATQNLAIAYANTSVNTIFGIDATQNLAIAYANTSVNTIFGIDATQNLAIAYANTTVNAVALSAYSSANIANISYVTAGAYGGPTAIPQVVVAANGRIVSISNTAFTAGGGSSSGYRANSVIFANSTGFLSNTANLIFDSSNNALDVNGSIILSNTRTSNSASIVYNAALNSIDFIFNLS